MTRAPLPPAPFATLDLGLLIDLFLAFFDPNAERPQQPLFRLFFPSFLGRGNLTQEEGQRCPNMLQAPVREWANCWRSHLLRAQKRDGLQRTLVRCFFRPTFHAKWPKPIFGDFNGFSPKFLSIFNRFRWISCHFRSVSVSFSQF